MPAAVNGRARSVTRPGAKSGDGFLSSRDNFGDTRGTMAPSTTRPSLRSMNYSDLGAVAGPSRAITSAALLDSMVRVQILVAGPPFASFQAKTT